MKYDLNIENYTFDDLLNLFGITSELTESQLRHVKKTAAMMHPDKSGLEKEVFIFFRHAASILAEVGSSSPCPRATSYSNDLDIEDKFYEHIGRDGSFSSRFNKLFDDFKALKGEDGHSGHGEWLKQSDKKDVADLKSTGELHRNFEKERNRLAQLVEYKPVSDYDVGAGELITTEKSSNDAALFSRLGYRDLRAAYEESITPSTTFVQKSFEDVVSERGRLTLSDFKTSFPDSSLKDKARRFALSREQVRVQKAMSELASNLLSQ